MFDSTNFDFIIKEAIQVLNSNGCILYPTETVWGLGCDAGSFEAVEKIFCIKDRPKEKSLIVLVSDINMLHQYVPDLSSSLIHIITTYPKPLSIIYKNAIGFASNCYHADGSIAIRVSSHEFCRQLISNFGRPIVSTSANSSGQPTPSSFQSISKDILNRVDYVVNLPNFVGSGNPSTIAQINEEGHLSIVRA